MATVCVVILLLLVTVQAVHTHVKEAHSGATCLVCISAHTSAPTVAMTALVTLSAIASIVLFCERLAPTAGTILPIFIRPPPSR